MLVGLCFLVATFTFAIGSALIHSHFSSGTSRDGTLVAGVFLLACSRLAILTRMSGSSWNFGGGRSNGLTVTQ